MAGSFIEFDTAPQDIERKAAIAKLLMEQSMQPQNGQMVSGIYVGPGALSSVSRLANAAIGNRMSQQANQERKNYLNNAFSQFETDIGDAPTQSQALKAQAKLLMKLNADPTQIAQLMGNALQLDAQRNKLVKRFSPLPPISSDQASNMALTQTAAAGQPGPTVSAAQNQQQLIGKQQYSPNNPYNLDPEMLADAAMKDPFKALELTTPKYSQKPEFDRAGNAYVLDDRGNFKYLTGISARPELMVAGDKVIDKNDPSNIGKDFIKKNWTYEKTDLGDKVAVYRVEPTTGVREFVGYEKKGVDPSTVYTGGITMRGQNMTDKRERDLAQKPTWDSERGVLVSPWTGKAVAVAGPDGKPLQPKNGNLTEDQAKATGWLVQAQNAYRNMQSVIKINPDAAKPGFNDALAGIPSFGLTEGAANFLRSADRQKFMQSASSLSEALLRAATGAGVNKSEAEQKVKELTPQFGDSDAVIAQKMNSIPLYIDSLQVRSGPGAAKAETIINASQTPENSPQFPSQLSVPSSFADAVRAERARRQNGGR